MSDPRRGDIDSAGGPLLSPARLGDVNRSRVLQTIVDRGPLSRADLSKHANVTRATIGNIVQSLIDAEILEELEPRAGQVGKPARPLWFAPRAAPSVVVALDDHCCRVAISNARGDLLDPGEVAYKRADPSRQEVERCLRKALDGLDGHPDLPDIVGVGVSVPGSCDPDGGEVLGSSVVPALGGTWLHELLSERFGVPVIVDNDSRAQALAEKWFGLGRGYATFASVQAGRGIGVGVVVNGSIFRAERGIGAEFGHTVVDLKGEPCRCGRYGCWETVAGSDWLRREAKRLGWKRTNHLDAVELTARSEDDAEAAALLERYADNVAVGLVNLMHVYHPRRIILHGEVAAAGEPLRAAIERALRRRTLEILHDDIDVVRSELSERAGLLGAAALVLSDRFHLAV